MVVAVSKRAKTIQTKASAEHFKLMRLISGMELSANYGVQAKHFNTLTYYVTSAVLVRFQPITEAVLKLIQK